MNERTVRVYDKEFKLNAIQLYLSSGHNYPKISSELGIPMGTLATWVRSYKAEGKDAFPGKGNIKPADADRLSKEFDLLFATKTNYDQLNDRIAKTKEKKSQLLLVLEFPFLPLHNNDSELGARNQARKRDVSFHTMSLAGTKAKDTFMTIKQTAKKLAVNFYDYIGDRINKTYEMPSLAELIVERSQKMVLNST